MSENSWDWNYDQNLNNMLSTGTGYSPTGGTTDTTDSNLFSTLGLDKSTTSGLNALGSVASGAGSLWSGYLNYLNYKAAEDQQKVANTQWAENYEAARTALNRKYAINDNYANKAGGYVEGSRIAESKLS